MKNLAMITLARSGSSYFTRSVKKNFSFLRGTAEIFHPNKSSQDIINNIFKHNNLKLSKKLEIKVNQFISSNTLRKRPELTLKLLNEISSEAGLSGVFFKIMEGHLINPQKDLEKLYGLENINFFFLTRNVVDSIISLLKARETNFWHDTNTTNLRIHVKSNEFIDIYKRDSKWLKESYRLLSAKTEVSKIKYEDIFNKLNKPNKVICDFINRYIGDDICYEEFDHMIMQDKNEVWEDKVTNPNEVKEVILSNDIPNHYSDVIDDI